MSFSRRIKPGVPTSFNRYKEVGQALAETAITLVFLIFLLSAVVDFGRAMFTWLALQNAVAEGAYYASTFSDPDRVGTVGTNDQTKVLYRVQHESPSVLLDWTTPGVNTWVTYTPPLNNQDRPRPGTIITVHITYPLKFIGPLPGIFGISEIPLYAASSQTVLNDNDFD